MGKSSFFNLLSNTGSYTIIPTVDMIFILCMTCFVCLWVKRRSWKERELPLCNDRQVTQFYLIRVSARPRLLSLPIDPEVRNFFLLTSMRAIH